MHYNFYFDETFHDRKISINSDGMINTFTKDKNDSYIGVFWGFKNVKRSSVIKKLNNLEQKYIIRYGVQSEFKSTTINRKNFCYGIRSFNKNTIEFYTDLFKVLEDISPIIHVNVISKIEWLIRNLFDICSHNEMQFVNADSFYYSLTKFILIYHNRELIQALYKSYELKDNRLFQDELLSQLLKVISVLEGIERKKREIPALRDLYFIIKNYNMRNEVKNKYDFIYFQNFDGLINLLEELKISLKKVNLEIDNEEKTYQVALNYNFSKIKQSDSKNVISIRIADHLCGFIGRMMYALMNDEAIKEDNIDNIDNLKENDLTRKRLLNLKWFDLEEKHFILYKLVYKVLVLQQSSYWSAMSLSYGDQVSMFYTLLRYISTFDSFNAFKRYSPEEHVEYYNSACCEELERHFNSFYEK